MNTVIRKAVVEDAERLAQVAEETFRVTFSAENSTEDMNIHCQKNFGNELQQAEILDINMVTLLCETNDLVIGFAQLCWQEAPNCLSDAIHPAEIRRLYVVSDFHGKGVAQELMAACIEETANRGSETAWLGVWENNPRAISFYKKLNFSEVGEHKFKLGSDLQRDIIMSRTSR